MQEQGRVACVTFVRGNRRTTALTQVRRLELVRIGKELVAAWGEQNAWTNLDGGSRADGHTADGVGRERVELPNTRSRARCALTA